AQAGASSSHNTTSGAPKPPVVQPGTGNNIIVNPCQRGNPILECVKNVGKEFGDILADYQVGRATGVLFLSLRYHRLHPEYIHQRIERLGHSYDLRVLLLMCDVSEHQDPIRELTKVCLINNITIMVAWSAEEAGYYLSTYKQFEHKPPDLIKERVDKDYHSVLRNTLTTISRVNKTDVETLRATFGSFAGIAGATSEQLQNLPGFGQVKVSRMQDAFGKPFLNKATTTLPSSFTQPTRAEPAVKDKGKGKERATDTEEAVVSGSTVTPRAPRAPSPVWDIELELNESPSTSPRADLRPDSSPISSVPAQPGTSATDNGAHKKRPSSPIWDIELDLNEYDLEEPAEIETSKKRR
ncbi:DNA repair protein rad10, partial [Laetiporus sulphureus 93-53]